jgi:hypothetical protein
MNFWKLLRWISAAIFIVLILLGLVMAQLHFDFSVGGAQDAPRPAPLIVH